MFTFNTETYTSWNPLSIWEQDDIAINGFWLQNEYIITSFLWEQNNIDFTNFDLPKTNGRGLLWYYERGKKIDLKIIVKWVDKYDFQDRLDELRKNLFIPESRLDVKYNWTIRRIKVNCLSAPKNIEHYNNTFLQLDLSFETLEPFFYDINYQTSSFLNRTANFNEEITNLWTAISETKIFLAFKTWISWVNNIIITFWDKVMTLNETITDNDVIIINWEDKTVQINWIDVDYNWVFTPLEINSNIINFTINGVYNCDINVLNKVNYI